MRVSGAATASDHLAHVREFERPSIPSRVIAGVRFEQTCFETTRFDATCFEMTRFDLTCFALIRRVSM
jgi:hypothetical protein